VKQWLQVAFCIDEPFIEPVENALEEIGALSVSFSDQGDSPILEPLPGTTPYWPELRVTALLNPDADQARLTTLINRVVDPGGDITLEFTVIEDRDWIAEWRSELQPMRFGHKLWVLPDGEASQPENCAAVWLAPGLAFGTGSHPTTSMCLEWLDSLAADQNTILDYGCGTGILAIAALALGAKRAICVDIDEQALRACQHNAKRNNCSEAMSIILPAALPTETRCDILVANILSGPLVGLADELRQYCNRGTNIALSGILIGQADEVSDAFISWVNLKITRQIDDWVLLTGTTAR